MFTKMVTHSGSKRVSITEKEIKAATVQDKTVLSKEVSRHMSSQTHTEGIGVGDGRDGSRQNSSEWKDTGCGNHRRDRLKTDSKGHSLKQRWKVGENCKGARVKSQAVKGVSNLQWKKVTQQPNSWQKFLRRHKFLGHRMAKNLYLKFQKGRANSPKKNMSKEEASKETCSAATIPLPCSDSDSSQLLEDGPCGLDLDGEMLIVKNAPMDYDTKVNGVLSENFICYNETSDFVNSMDKSLEALPTVDFITGDFSSAPLNVSQKNGKILSEHVDVSFSSIHSNTKPLIYTESSDSRCTSHRSKCRASRSMMAKCNRKKRSKHVRPLVMRQKIQTLTSARGLLNQFTRTLHAIKCHGRTDELSHSRRTRNGFWTITSTRPDQRNASANGKLPDTPMLSITERPTVYYSLSEIVKYVEVMTTSFKSMLNYLHGKETVSQIDSLKIKDQLEGYICFTHDKIALLLNFIAVLDDHQILLLSDEELKHVWHVHDVITCLLQAYRHLKVLKPEDIPTNHLTSLVVLCAEVLVPRRKFPLDKWSRCMKRVLTIQTKMLENKTFVEVCQCRNIFSVMIGKNQCALCDCNVLFQELCYGRTESCKMEDSANVFDDMIHDPQLASSGHFYLEEFTPTLHWFSSNLNNVEKSELQKIIDIHNSQAFSCHPDAGLYACSKHRSVRVCRCFEEPLQPMKECLSLNNLNAPKVGCSDAFANNKSEIEESVKKNLKLVTSDVHDSNTTKMAVPFSKPSSQKECRQCQNNDEDSHTFVEHCSESCAASNFNEKIGEKCITGDSTGESNRENSTTSEMWGSSTAAVISSLKMDQKHDIPHSLAQPSDSSKQVEMKGDEFSLRVSDSDSSIEDGGKGTIGYEQEACQIGSSIKACSKANNDFCNMNKKEDCIQSEEVISFLDLDFNKYSTVKTMHNTVAHISGRMRINKSDEILNKPATPVVSDEIYSQFGQRDPDLETDSHSVHSLSGSNSNQSTIDMECAKSIPSRHSLTNEKQESHPNKLASTEHISPEVDIEEIPVVISMQDTSQDAKCTENRKGSGSKTVLSKEVSRHMSSQTHTEGGDSEEELTKIPDWDKIFEQYEIKRNVGTEFPACVSSQKVQKHSQPMKYFSKVNCTVSPSTVDITGSDSSEVLITDSEDGGDSLQVQFSNSTEEKNNASDASGSSYQGKIMLLDVGTKELSSWWNMGNISDPCKSINASEEVYNKIQDADVTEVQKELKRQSVSDNSSISNLRKEQKECPNTDGTSHISGQLDQQSCVQAGKSKRLNSKIKQTRLSLKKEVVPKRTEVLDQKSFPESSEFFKPSDCNVRGDNNPSKQDHQNKTMNALERQRESAQLSYQPTTGCVSVVDMEQKHSACLQKPVENCTLDLKEAGTDERTPLLSDKRKERSPSKDQDTVFEAKQNDVCEGDKPESLEIESKGSEHPLKMAEQNQSSISSEGLDFVRKSNKIMSEESRQENVIQQISNAHQKPHKKVRFSENVVYSCDTKKSHKNDLCKRISKRKNTLSITDSLNKKFSKGDILQPCKEEVYMQTSWGTTMNIRSKDAAKLQMRSDKLQEMKMKTKTPSVILEHSDTGDVAEKHSTDSVSQKDAKKVNKKHLSGTIVCPADADNEILMHWNGPQHVPERPSENISSSYNNGVECLPTFSVKETSEKYSQNGFCEADTNEMFKTFLNEVIRVLDRRELKCKGNMAQESSSSGNSHVDLSILSSKSDETMKQPVNNQSIAEKKKRAHLSRGKKSESDSLVKKRKMNQPREEHGSDPNPSVCESDSDDEFQLYVNGLKRQFGVFSG